MDALAGGKVQGNVSAVAASRSLARSRRKPAARISPISVSRSAAVIRLGSRALSKIAISADGMTPRISGVGSNAQ
jgi:hypothetical protein